MRHALVVVESQFGNTRALAEVVADGLAEHLQVTVVDVSDAPERLNGVDLLVAGGPTHAFGMTRAATRASAVEQGGTPCRLGLREWTAGARPSASGTAVATFDTRIKKRGVPGSAARGAVKALRRRGFGPVDGTESFWVTGTSGPLADGELVRARNWGERLARALVTRMGQVIT